MKKKALCTLPRSPVDLPADVPAAGPPSVGEAVAEVVVWVQRAASRTVWVSGVHAGPPAASGEVLRTDAAVGRVRPEAAVGRALSP